MREDGAARSFIELIQHLPKQEFCSYLSGDFYLTYPFFLIFGVNKWGLAIPHMIFTLLGFYFLYKICQRHFQSNWAYAITFLIVCFNASLTQHAFEIRVYAVLPTLALASLYFSQIIVHDYGRLRRLQKFLLGLFFLMVIWFHAYGILIVFFPVMYCLGTVPRNQNFKLIFLRMIKFFSIILIVAAPLWIISIFGDNLFMRPRYPFDFIPNPAFNGIGFLKGVFLNLVGFKLFYVFYIGLLISFVLPHDDRWNQIGFFLCLIILPILLLLVSDLRSHYWFLQRQFIWVMPFCAFLLGWCWDSCLQYFSKRLKVR